LVRILHPKSATSQTEDQSSAAGTLQERADLSSKSLERSATVVIPALNEAKRIAEVVAYALSDPATLEVIVIDDSSIDDTAFLARNAGARVLTSSMLGKGASMKDGVNAAQSEIIVFLDGDLAGLQPEIITKLARPIAQDGVDFVKARFGRSGGRVTELTAKPMLKVFFPELAHFAQPLGGIIAGKRSLLASLTFEDGYGVDIGLLIGAHRASAKLAEVDIGSLENDSQPLEDLTYMANEVARVIHAYARRAGRLHVEQISAMYEAQRQAAASIEHVLLRRRGRRRILLLDMDGTLTEHRFVVALARATGRERELAALLDQTKEGSDAVTRSRDIAQLFRFVHKREFERIASELPLASGAIDFVNRMRRVGFMVGVVSDSYFVAADVIRRRIFADFSLAHLMTFDNDVASGELGINPAFFSADTDREPQICKRHVIERFRADPNQPWVLECWAIGDNVNDIGMLRAADTAFALNPKTDEIRSIPGIRVVRSFDELLPHVPERYATAASMS
jgi:phosphoserine phosphatase